MNAKRKVEWLHWLLVSALVLFPYGPLEAAQQGQAPAQPQQGQAPAQVTPEQVDALTAPIALYPDALLAQILAASGNFFQLQSFSAWLGKNSKLTGTALQEAAQKEGYDAAYIALAPFPQVVQMMMQKPDWTKQLGQLFQSNRSDVFDSIQRLRAKAQAVGNLKTSEQQEVKTETTSSGQQVIVIQPANPQVIYVPQYNPTVVYVQAAPAPAPSSSGGNVAAAAVIGFTAGIIIGAAANNSYYYGPYGWHGAAMYNEAWDDYYDHREDAREDWQDHRQDMNENRQQSAAQGQQSRQQNQGTRQTTQSGPQSSAQAGQSSRQPSAQSSQTSRQSSASTSSRSSGQSASQRSGTSSGGFSDYSSGASTRSQSSRGKSSRSSSKSSGRSGGRSRK